MIIEHIDAIARKKQRDVLFVIFVPPGSENASKNTYSFEDDKWDSIFDYENNSIRQQVLSWLSESNIPYNPCGSFANEHRMIAYMGQLYLDVPFNFSDPNFQKLQNYFENTDGTMKLPGVKFCYVKLNDALRNSHHDEPGFWERWADTF